MPILVSSLIDLIKTNPNEERAIPRQAGEITLLRRWIRSASLRNIRSDGLIKRNDFFMSVRCDRRVYGCRSLRWRRGRCDRQSEKISSDFIGLAISLLAEMLPPSKSTVGSWYKEEARKR